MNSEVVKTVLGIDTSNYRTSLCLVNEQGAILAEEKELLPVEHGKLGLKQSDAVFQHVLQLPVLAEKLFANCRAKHGVHPEISAVAVSTAPRPVQGSYMPVFRSGEAIARCLAAAYGVPLYTTTHQEGHIAAGEYSTPAKPAADRFLAVHLSGGTSEILLCTRSEQGYEIEKLGGTKDLHAGQLIDRIGVAMGMPFPAGPYLEKLADEGEHSFAPYQSFSVPSSVMGMDFHFSGAETALLRTIESQKAPYAEIARAAEQMIANTLEKALRNAFEQGYPREVLVVGGVAANRHIRRRLYARLEHPSVAGRLFFTEPAYSGDNAFGVAMIGLKRLEISEKTER